MTIELKDNKHKYFQSYFATHKQNMKQVWSGIKSIISHKGCNTSTISRIMDKNGKVSPEPTKISNIYNEYFINVANSITENIPKSQKSAANYLRNNISTSIFLSPVTHKEIEGIISTLDSSKSIGPFSMPINLLKILKLHISHPLTKLFNKLFLKGVLPSKLKISKVIPLLKQGDLNLHQTIDLSPCCQSSVSCVKKLCTKDCIPSLHQIKLHILFNLAFKKITMLTTH